MTRAGLPNVVVKKALFGLVVMAALTGTAYSHEMGFDVLAGDGDLQGRLQYSDGSSAAQEFIRINNLTNAGYSPLVLQTDHDGNFRVAGMPGHRYAVTAEGEEGHSITIEAVVPSRAGIPFYGWLALLLLLSIVPAWWLQRRQQSTTRTLS